MLELEPNATLEQVKEARRVQAKVWHPDRFPRDERMQHKAQERIVLPFTWRGRGARGRRGSEWRARFAQSDSGRGSCATCAGPGAREAPVRVVARLVVGRDQRPQVSVFDGVH